MSIVNCSRYTRRTFFGRGPLCGIGVTSLIDNTLNPWLASERIAESRPLPTPETSTSTLTNPVFFTFSASAEMVLEAANGVAFFGPENPSDPAEAQARTLP